MHLGNGIICPITGIPMLAIAGVSAIWALKKARKDFKKENIPQTAALTAFVFALQMINFTIPSTGSSGHIIGAVLLSALLGPYAAFLQYHRQGRAGILSELFCFLRFSDHMLHFLRCALS